MFQPRVARILKGGLDAHAQRVCADARFSSWQIGNEELRFLIGVLPTSTDIGLQGLLLPDACAAIPLLPFGMDEALTDLCIGS